MGLKNPEKTQIHIVSTIRLNLFQIFQTFPTFQEKIWLFGGASLAEPAGQPSSQLANKRTSRLASQPPASRDGSESQLFYQKSKSLKKQGLAMNT